MILDDIIFENFASNNCTPTSDMFAKDIPPPFIYS